MLLHATYVTHTKHIELGTHTQLRYQSYAPCFGTTHRKHIELGWRTP